MADTSTLDYISYSPWTDLFHVSPTQFNIVASLGKEKYLRLSIVNNGTHTIAWKLKTNRPGRYMVSPKQGIIAADNHQDCTVVLSKLKVLPDTKKPDKFLIQATKIDATTKDFDLPQLWRERESKHNKKGGVFAYQAITIKCYLDVTTTTPLAPIQVIPEDHDQPEQSQNDNNSVTESKRKEEKDKVTIIEDYVSSESTMDHESPSKPTTKNENVEESTRSTPIPEAPSISNASYYLTMDEESRSEQKQEVQGAMISNNNNKVDQQQIQNAEDQGQRQKTSLLQNTKPVPNTVNLGSSDPSTLVPNPSASPRPDEVEQWKRKAMEYDELFKFTRKTLAQRDELNQRWKHEQEKARKYETLSREMREEKKKILAQYTQLMNQRDDEDGSIENAEDEEKKQVLSETVTKKRQRAKKESLREMEEMDRKAIRNSKKGLTVSIVHILITVVLMMASYQYGQWNVNVPPVVNEDVGVDVNGQIVGELETDKEDASLKRDI